MRRIALVAAVVLAALPAAADQIVTELSGAGTTNTRPFTVTGPWEIQWTSSDRITIYAIDATGLPSVSVSSPEGGTGASFMPMPGTYYLNVVGSFATWSIKIVEITVATPAP